MDHYEELGLDRSASPEEIRQAYKRLARLLHPDLCSEEPARQLADLQMKRLNGVLAVLTSPVERANYDRSLARRPGVWQLPRVSPPGRIPFQREWYWAAVGVAAMLGILPLLVRPETHPPQRVPAETAASETTPPAKEPVRRHAPVRTRPSMALGRTAETKPQSEPPTEFSAAAGPRLEPETPRTGGLPSLPDEPPFHFIQPIPSARAPVHPTLAGEWLYAPASHSKKATLYPPEYIELRVTEEAGILRGRYLARYHISDLAISPTVWFQFAGAAEGDAASFPWIGIGGAKGEVSLRLVDSGALEVTWVATQMGGELGLISGTATLVRRLD